MSFDRLAPYYCWIELSLAGGKLHRCRTAFLGQIPTPKNILLLGEGHGRSLVECRRTFAHAQITCVDASADMLIQARRQLSRHNLEANQVEFIHADALNLAAPPHRYDLVVANFFLDCFRPDQLEKIIFKITTSSTPDASWLLADFQIPDAGWRRIRSQLILWLLYRFFRATARLPAHKLTKPDSLLEKAGFTLHRRIESEWGLLHSDWWRKGNSNHCRNKIFDNEICFEQ
jgi:ubiquinone/menaquinone biosynthesis C-methylase UbiE